ncbi:unnamed protein product [Boreogadus saida]
MLPCATEHFYIGMNGRPFSSLGSILYYVHGSDPTDHLMPHTDALPPPTDALPPPTDGLPPPTDALPPPTDGLPPPTDGMHWLHPNLYNLNTITPKEIAENHMHLLKCV